MRRLLGLLPIAFVVFYIAGHHSSGASSSAPPPPGAATDVGRVPSGCHTRGSGLYVLPDPRCSPGARDSRVTQANLSRTICKSGYSKSVRPPESVTAPEKIKDMRAYGIHGSTHGYELDHIISLELGGAPNSYANYYPERDYPNPSGFYLNPKDHLEGALHRLVCDGKMSLAEAQHLIAMDWVGAYHRYG